MTANSKALLSKLYPAIARDWLSEKNGSHVLAEIGWTSKVRVWWRCEKGHEYEASVYTRGPGETLVVEKFIIHDKKHASEKRAMFLGNLNEFRIHQKRLMRSLWNGGYARGHGPLVQRIPRPAVAGQLASRIPLPSRSPSAKASVQTRDRHTTRSSRRQACRSSHPYGESCCA